MSHFKKSDMKIVNTPGMTIIKSKLQLFHMCGCGYFKTRITNDTVKI